MLTTLIIFLATLSMLVLVHELGHFLAAKSIGITVETFSIGFPPKIWAKKVGDTVYQVCWLLLGGYVKLRGEYEEDENTVSDPKSLLSRTPLEQLYIFVAGVIMNFLLAVIIFWLIFSIGTRAILPDMPDYKGLQKTNQVVITGVEKDTAADKEGLKTEDQILDVDGRKINDQKEVVDIIQGIDSGKNEKVNLEILRDNKVIKKSVAVYKGKISGPNGEIIEGNRIGIVLSNEEIVKANVIVALKVALLESFRIIKITFAGIISLFSLLLTKFTISPQVTGPVGIYVATGYFASLGFTIYLQFVAVISLSLALFNILPIPALDGGQIFFTLLEVVARRKLSYRVKNLIQLAGFSLLILLMLVVTMKDLVNFNIINNILH
jgi:regulator of sigma E protease